MSKVNYIRQRESLTVGGRSKLHCKKYIFWTYRKDEIKEHNLKHKK